MPTELCEQIGPRNPRRKDSSCEHLPDVRVLCLPTHANAARGTLRDHESALILRTLKASAGVIGGPRGAAAPLGVKRCFPQAPGLS